MTKVNQSRIREALTAGTNVKEKGPPVADGILSVTPDTPEMLEWRSRSALDVAETSSTFLDDEDDGPKPHELYGKFTWKIENFSEISKRELRSNVFDVGSYKWYILVYPQGCDVCNHLSLFLCVADYDKLLPGWSHFAQFTIAVVNKEPKKSKYSDTLHRFCKKEHDWGWKKFMELSKVLDGFTVADTLVIKAQVQVILDKPSKPFRCLDPQYRRELVRVYLTNVEGICRRFCEDKKSRLAWAREEASSFRLFWSSLNPEQQRKHLTDKGEVILKAVVKQFFNEKEVTSTLVMDALYSGCKQMEEHSRTWLEGKCSDNAPLVLIKAERSTFTLCGDLMDLVDRVQKDYIPAVKDDNKALQPNDGLTLRSGQDGDDYRRDSIERDEKRLAELGRKTVEMFVIAHIFCERLEIAYREAEALKRQDQLIAEEFETARLEESKAQAKAQADKEKKAKKKEKLKLKKEAEKLKREVEEAERKAREDEARRQEVERKVKEAERKRLEEVQTQQLQQPLARKGVKGRDDRRAQQLQQQQAKGKQQQQATTFAPTQPHTQATGQTKPFSEASDRGWNGLPSLFRLAAVAVATDMADARQLERPDPREGSASGCSSDEEVCTVNQATGAVESSGDGEEDAGAASSAADGPGGTLTDSDGASDTESRAALEEEVSILRAQVAQLQKLLAERDAELFALRAQLAELQPTEIADTVNPRSAAAAHSAASAARTVNSTASSSGSVSLEKSGVAAPAMGMHSSLAPSASGVMHREAAGMATVTDSIQSPAGTIIAANSERGSVRPGGEGKYDTSMANGPKDGLTRTDAGPSPSSSTAAATAAAAAAAAVRRMQSHSTCSDVSIALVPGAVPARPSSTGPTVSGATAAVATATSRGLLIAASAPLRQAVLHSCSEPPSASLHLQVAGVSQQPVSGATAGPGGTAESFSDGHVAAAPIPGGMMQRSTSATLPAVTGTSGTTSAIGPYTSLGQHHMGTTSTANGRQRSQAVDTALGPSNGVVASTGNKSGPYLPASSTGTSSVGASTNGTMNVLHTAAAAQDGLPSYRNAAAGVLSTSAPPGGHSLSTSAAAAAGAVANSVSVSTTPMLPISPSGPGIVAAAAASAASRLHKAPVEEGPSAAAARVAAAGRHMPHPVTAVTASSNDGAFSAQSARIMMQQAQRASLAFSTPPTVSSISSKRMATTTQLDSPGLGMEDFAHISLIDDLLTE